MTTIIKVINWDLEVLPNSESYFEILYVDILGEALQFKCPMRFEKFAINNMEQNKIKWLRSINDIEFKKYHFYELDFSQRTNLYVEYFEKLDDINFNYPCGDTDKFIDKVKYL